MLCAFKGTIFPPFLLWVVLCVWFFVLFVFLLFFFYPLRCLVHLYEVCSGNFPPLLAREEEAGWKGRNKQLSFRFQINAAP